MIGPYCYGCQAEAQKQGVPVEELPKILTEVDYMIEITTLRDALLDAHEIVKYVSRGKGYISASPYPDAMARLVNAKIEEALR
jgi:hypothetical protein